MPNPLIPQGVINRVRASIDFPSFPSLRVSASYLGKEGMSISFSALGEPIPTMTGVATSPQPYAMATITVHLVRCQALASLFRTQIEASTYVSAAKLYTDTSVLGDFTLRDVQITAIEPVSLNGSNADFNLTLTGVYDINSDMWNL